MTVQNQEYCSLQEAVEWIAYRKNPEELTAEYVLNHRDALTKAMGELLFGIGVGRIHTIAYTAGEDYD